uniref:Putative ovule protein n=1 Tax=Solanum chacoense TaxID=4108 RepID=A0A0V0I1H5_SOLCH
MSRYYDDDLWTPFDSTDTLLLQRLISLRFYPMRGANAISSCFLVSRVIMSEAKLDNCGQLCFSLLLLIVVKSLSTATRLQSAYNVFA